MNWDGRDAFEQPGYDPTGNNWQNGNAKRLMLAGNFVVNAVAWVDIGYACFMSVASSATVSKTSPAYQLAVQPHSGHYGDDWPRASVYRFGRGGIAKGNLLLAATGIVPDDISPQGNLAPMLLNYFDPAVYGITSDFYMNFRARSSDKFMVC